MDTCLTHTEQSDSISCYLLQLQNTPLQLQKAIPFNPHGYVLNSDHSLRTKLNLTQNLSYSMLQKNCVKQYFVKLMTRALNDRNVHSLLSSVKVFVLAVSMRFAKNTDHDLQICMITSWQRSASTVYLQEQKWKI